MNDITNRADIGRLMEAFYGRALQDEVIGHFFTETIHLDLEKHLPVIINFWESVLLNVSSYRGNPIHVHRQLHALSPMTKAHFDRWLALFYATLDELFSGPVTELARTRALSIATMMQIKLADTSTH